MIEEVSRQIPLFGTGLWGCIPNTEVRLGSLDDNMRQGILTNDCENVKDRAAFWWGRVRPDSFTSSQR